MRHKICDGWHTFLGYRVWVEKNRVKYADDEKYGVRRLYRRVATQWIMVDSVSVATFYTGVKRGYIAILNG